MAFNTGNPIGSTSPKDLSDNARNLDLLLLGDDPAYPDRKGVPRKSWKGMEHEHTTNQARRESEFDTDQARRESEYDSDKMERDVEFAHDQAEKGTEFDAAQNTRVFQFNTFMDASGYEPPIPYAPGILLDRATKTVTYLGNEYRARSSFIPFTSSNWSTDESKLKLIGDDSLSQKLADPISPENGSSKLGRGVVAIATIADLMAIPAAARRTDLRYLVAEYANGTGLGGGEFRWASGSLSATVAADPYRGLTVPPVTDPTGASGAFFRVFSGEMCADWFGVVYGQTVDVTARLNAANNLITAGRSLRVRGDVLVGSLWECSNLPPGWTITVEGKIYAAPGAFLPLRTGGIYCHFKAKGLEKLGGVREGQCYEMLSTFFGSVKITSIDKFGEGVQFIGVHSRPNGVNGIAWCNINIKNVNVLGTCALFTTRTDTPGKTNGYINENSIRIGYMGGEKGIHFKKGPDQIEQFGGNKIIKPGFERITGVVALDLEHCTRTTIEDWRFEGSGIAGLQIREDAGCSRNVYRGSWSLISTKLQFGGILAKVDAQIINEGGSTLTYGFQQFADGTICYFNDTPWAAAGYSNAISLRVKAPNLGFPERIEVKGASGINGFLEVKTQKSDQIVPVGSTAVDVVAGTTILSVSLYSLGFALNLVLNMPMALELNGREIKLNISNFTAGNTISIKKSSGAINTGAGVTSAGLYSLAYFGDTWRTSKIGEAYSA